MHFLKKHVVTYPVKSVISCCILLSICSIAHAQITMTVDQYVEHYKKMAIDEMDRSGIPASITLAQGILESSYGNSELARYANNHFGIKCHGEWYGGEYYLKDDDRDKKGNLIRSCFRVYSSSYESYVDHTEFLMGKQRYAFLFNFPKEDYISWARGLKTAGYATSPTYADKLIKVIEENNLHQYDYMTNRAIVTTTPLPPPPVEIVEVKEPEIIETIEEPMPTVSVEEEILPESIDVPQFPKGYQSGVFMINQIKTVSAKVGDSPSDVAARHNISLERLLKYNDLKHGDELVTNQYIFLQPKRGKYRERRAYHLVKERDNMYIISQLYGISLSNLSNRNLLVASEEPAVGEKIYLSGKTLRKPDLRQGTRVVEPVKIETEKAPKPKVEKEPKLETKPKEGVKNNPLASITEKFKPKKDNKSVATKPNKGKGKTKDTKKNDKDRIYNAVTTKTAKPLSTEVVPARQATTSIENTTNVETPILESTTRVVETPVTNIPEMNPPTIATTVEIPQVNQPLAIKEVSDNQVNISPSTIATEEINTPIVHTPVYENPSSVIGDTPGYEEQTSYDVTTKEEERLTSAENYYVIIDENGKAKQVPFKKPVTSQPESIAHDRPASSSESEVGTESVIKEVYNPSIYEASARIPAQNTNTVTPNEHITTNHNSTATTFIEEASVVESVSPIYESTHTVSISKADTKITTDYYSATSEPVAEGNYGRRHRVHKGDTLYNLSIRYGVDIQALRNRNGIVANNIKVGQELLID